MTILTFEQAGDASCDPCKEGWQVSEQLLDSDCPEELAAMSLGPEDLRISPWLGWDIDDRVHGENLDGLVELPAVRFDDVDRTEGPQRWIDVYATSLLER